MRVHANSPVTFPNSTWSYWRSGSDRRIFVTILDKSTKAVAAVTLEQAISIQQKTQIVSLERISIIMMPGEKKRVSVSVEDVMNKVKSIDGSPESVGNPVITVVSVEFLDGTSWNAP